MDIILLRESVISKSEKREFIMDEVYILGGLGAISLACIVWWITDLFSDVGEEFAALDIRQVGVFYLMLPLAKKFGRLGEYLRSTPLRRYITWAKKHLALSGLDEIFTPSDFVGAHVLLFFLGFLTGILFLLAAPHINTSFILTLTIFLALVLLFLPFYYLYRITSERRISIFKGLPYFLDLLTLLVEAGMEFTEAIDRTATMLGKGHLAMEMKRFSKQIHLGLSRSEALKELGSRIDLPEMQSFISALLQQDQLGSSLSTVLRTQSDILRFKRLQYAEEMANKTPVKILFPLIFFIFPSVFLILVGPMLIRSAGSIFR